MCWALQKPYGGVVEGHVEIISCSRSRGLTLPLLRVVWSCLRCLGAKML